MIIVLKRVGSLASYLWTHLLFWLAYAVVALVDFFAYKFWGKDLRELSWFAAFGALSFTGLLYGWCLYGFQVLVWGRYLRIGRWRRS